MGKGAHGFHGGMMGHGGPGLGGPFFCAPLWFCAEGILVGAAVGTGVARGARAEEPLPSGPRRGTPSDDPRRRRRADHPQTQVRVRAGRPRRRGGARLRRRGSRPPRALRVPHQGQGLDGQAGRRVRGVSVRRGRAVPSELKSCPSVLALRRSSTRRCQQSNAAIFFEIGLGLSSSPAAPSREDHAKTVFRRASPPLGIRGAASARS